MRTTGPLAGIAAVACRSIWLFDTRHLGASAGSYPNAVGGNAKSCGNFSGKPGRQPKKSFVIWYYAMP
ncbi:hypothetical protein [uncultured Draconibacterium sp.]|uniref:hypothetical protein n=1 Tax=uncultured Draconibacterium sp. TaxID=1573823 RepID=UPI003217BA7F